MLYKMSKVLHFYSLNLWQTCLGKHVLRQIITGRGVYCAARRGSHAEWIAPTGRVLVIRSFNQCTGLVVRWRLTRRSLCSAQVWFQNARAKFRRNLLRQESGSGDKASDGSVMAGGTPSGPVSDISNGSMSPPSSTPTTLTDLTNPTMPTVTSVLGGGPMDVHECRSPSQTTLTSLF